MWSGNWSHTVVFCQLVVLCGLVTGLTQWSSVSWWSCVEGNLFVPQRGQVLSVSQTCRHDGVWQALSAER